MGLKGTFGIGIYFMHFLHSPKCKQHLWFGVSRSKVNFFDLSEAHHHENVSRRTAR